MNNISKEEYDTKTEHDMNVEAEVLSSALQNDELVEETSSLIKKLCDGEPVNKNPLTEIPNPEMRLYYIDSNYFESIDELLDYCISNNISTEGLKVLDYYREFAGRSDVIRKQDCNTTMFYVAIDKDGYGTYNNERSINCGEFIWEYNYGTIREMYKSFRNKGIVFENDIYAEINKRNQKIL